MILFSIYKSNNPFVLKIYIWFIFLILQQVYARDSVEVTFIVEAENVPENSFVYITGNNSALGRWMDFLPMEFIDNKGLKKLKFQKRTFLEFKFTKGSWENEALNADKNIPPNHCLNVFNDTTLVFKIKYWSDQIIVSEEKKIIGQITGTVKYHKNYNSSEVRTRDISVWLPPNYEENHSQRFPVLYMHDGQNAFDPATSAFGVDWQIDEAADSLIRKKMIKPIIIVAINNTIERSSEYANNDTGYAYIRFIIDELKPFIDSTYRTLTDAKNTAVLGSSLGGLISLIIVWENPEIFSMAAFISGAIKIDRYDYINKIKSDDGEKKPLKFYFDNGGVGIEVELQPGIDELIILLKRSGYEEGEDFYWFKDIEAEHSEKAWAKRVWRPLIFFFGNNSSHKFLED